MSTLHNANCEPTIAGDTQFVPTCAPYRSSQSQSWNPLPYISSCLDNLTSTLGILAPSQLPPFTEPCSCRPIILRRGRNPLLRPSSRLVRLLVSQVSSCIESWLDHKHRITPLTVIKSLIHLHPATAMSVPLVTPAPTDQPLSPNSVTLKSPQLPRRPERSIYLPPRRIADCIPMVRRMSPLPATRPPGRRTCSCGK